MNIIIAVLLLGFLVAIHEFGHFIVAKISGMYVTTFSIGMGPKIASFQKGETEYVLSAIPAGGFVSVRGISGEAEEELDREDPRLFQNRPIIHRMLFTVAGPAMNFLLAIGVLMACYLVLGVEVVDENSPVVIEEVSADSPAEAAGLKDKDKIIEINGEPVQRWTDVDKIMSSYKKGELSIVYERADHVESTVLVPKYSDELEHYALGVTKHIETNHQEVGLSDAFKQSIFVTVQMSTVIFDAVIDLVTGETAVNDKEGGLAGPVGIVNAIGDSVSQGVWNVMSLLAVLSVNFGLLNMLPVPALDGSRFLFLIIEGIRGIPVSPDKEMLVNMVGMLGLMFLMIYVTYNDILQLVH